MVDINDLFNDFNSLMRDKIGKNIDDLSTDERIALSKIIQSKSDDVTGSLKQEDSIRDVLPIEEGSQAELRHGDCTLLIQEIPDRSIDLVLTDLPYGVTDASWDNKIDMDFLMGEFKRVIKPKGNIILTASREFSVEVLGAGYANGMYKGHYPWIKNRPSSGLNAKYMPLNFTEDIIHLSKYGKGKSTTYNNIFLEEVEDGRVRTQTPSELYGGEGEYEYKQDFKGYNRSYFEYDRAKIIHKHHVTERKNPTQKPIDLLRDLIMIFSDEGDLVLDITMGTGSTGVASLLSGRRFLGFDLDSEFFDIASGRMVMLLELLGQGVELDEDHYFWHYL